MSKALSLSFFVRHTQDLDTLDLQSFFFTSKLKIEIFFRNFLTFSLGINKAWISSDKFFFEKSNIIFWWFKTICHKGNASKIKGTRMFFYFGEGEKQTFFSVSLFASISFYLSFEVKIQYNIDKWKQHSSKCFFYFIKGPKHPPRIELV